MDLSRSGPPRSGGSAIPLVRAGGFKLVSPVAEVREESIPLVRAGGFKHVLVSVVVVPVAIPLVRAGGFKQLGCSQPFY